MPRSWHNPQFDQTSLPRSLKKAGLGYGHLPGPGGQRHAKRDSLNLAWRNGSFRGFADYMPTPKFAQGVDELIRMARREQVVLMCAEAVPWRCHRSLIADALLVRSGIQILSDHPRLDWNKHCTPGSEWIKITRNVVPTDRLWTSMDEAVEVSPWIAPPGGPSRIEFAFAPVRWHQSRRRTAGQ